VHDVADRVAKLAPRAAHIRQAMQNKRIQHREYIRRYGDDMPEVKEWTWGARAEGG
jgi:xylulose-5-phosphate/fructose-6-phosphate phosphoketolase